MLVTKFIFLAFLPQLLLSSCGSIVFFFVFLFSLAFSVSSNTYECRLQHLTVRDDLYQIPSMHTHFKRLPAGNHPLPAGSASCSRFESSLPSHQSPNQSIGSLPLTVTLSSITPERRHVKSPAPETTPTRLRQQIIMTSGASPSILGLQ